MAQCKEVGTGYERWISMKDTGREEWEGVQGWAQNLGVDVGNENGRKFIERKKLMMRRKEAIIVGQFTGKQEIKVPK